MGGIMLRERGQRQIPYDISHKWNLDTYVWCAYVYFQAQRYRE